MLVAIAVVFQAFGSTRIGMTATTVAAALVIYGGWQRHKARLAEAWLPAEAVAELVELDPSDNDGPGVNARVRYSFPLEHDRWEGHFELGFPVASEAERFRDFILQKRFWVRYDPAHPHRSVLQLEIDAFSAASLGWDLLKGFAVASATVLGILVVWFVAAMTQA